MSNFRCAKDIDTLIESLPNEDSSQELQTQSLRRLEIENQEAAKHLEEVNQRLNFNFTHLNATTNIDTSDRSSIADKKFWRKYKRHLVI